MSVLNESVQCIKGSRTIDDADPDPVSTEIVSHAFKSAANQMYITLLKTAVSPLVSETNDFSLGIFDERMRLLAPGRGLAIFLGSTGFMLEAAIRHAGGAECLQPGDVLMLNVPSETGTHSNDMGLAMPFFYENNEIVGYGALKMHVADVAGKAPYITDSTDVFQEGVFYPGVKIYKSGLQDPEIMRFISANSRTPRQTIGDIEAGVAALRTGSIEYLRIVRRFGLERIRTCIKYLLDHGEAHVRALLSQLPSGRYAVEGRLDNDGIVPQVVPLRLTVEINDSEIGFDFTDSPDEVKGPYNCPLPLTIAACRVAVSMLGSKGELPNEGHFRPIAIKTRPGSIFEPKPSSPSFLGGWAAYQVIELIMLAVSKGNPKLVPAGSGGDPCGVMLWGYREGTGEPWCDAVPLPVGQGGSIAGDGVTHNIIGNGGQRITSAEGFEAQYPILTECRELIMDSCGAGQFRGGLGVRGIQRALQDIYATPTVERTTFPGWGLAGGTEAIANAVFVHFPDGRKESHNKETGLFLPKGSKVEVLTGGGGGYGRPAERNIEALLQDYLGGYISHDYLFRYYPQAPSIIKRAKHFLLGH